MFMEIPKLSIRFIDSLNFLQMLLKSTHKTFGMNELKKGYFPPVAWWPGGQGGQWPPSDKFLGALKFVILM